MFLKVEIKEGTDEEVFAAKLRKQKEVVDVKISKPRKKKKEPMTDYYANGKQLSMKEFKARIADAEEDIKAGKFYTGEQLKTEMEKWKKEKGYK
jgi:hypothetical protein